MGLSLTRKLLIQRGYPLERRSTTVLTPAPLAGSRYTMRLALAMRLTEMEGGYPLERWGTTVLTPAILRTARIAPFDSPGGL